MRSDDECVKCHHDLKTVLVCNLCGTTACAEGELLCKEFRKAGMKFVCANCGSDGRDMDDSGLNEIEKKSQHLKVQEYEFKERIANSLERIAEALQRLANKE